ncbi:MAG: HAD-IA family hydrolase [Chloroflexi bacterium]|nr:HAD-IA family hydrolase [Chloroflexota bacterium]
MQQGLIIFDSDGVLVDSEVISNRVLVEMLASHGLRVSVEEAVQLFAGRPMSNIVAKAEELAGKTLPLDFGDSFYATRAEAFQRGALKAIAGVEQAIQQLQPHFAMCVASSGKLVKSQQTLGLTGLARYFDGRIFSGYEVARGKPFPDLFLYAAQRMGYGAEACTVVEDSVPGVQAGVAAGMRVLAYAGTAGTEALEAVGGEAFSEMRQLPGLATTRRPVARG